MDNKKSIEDLAKIAAKFIDERNWDQFITLTNLSSSISVEAAELIEIFLWEKPSDLNNVLKNKRSEIENEVGDILFCLLNFCNKANIDLTKAFENKMILTAKKYPLNK